MNSKVYDKLIKLLFSMDKDLVWPIKINLRCLNRDSDINTIPTSRSNCFMLF